jgi:hypothetical protein
VWLQAGAPANQVEQGRPVVPRTSGAPSAAPEAGARVAWARRLAALGEVCGVYALGLLLASLLFAALAWGYLYYRSGSLLVPIIAHALVNVPMGTSAAVGLVVLLLGVVVLAREPIKGALRTSWGLFSSAALPRRATALGGLALVLFAVLLAAMQDVALLLGLALLVVALVAETLEKRRQTSTRWALAVTRSTSAHMDSAAGPLVSGLLFDSASVALSCWVMIGLFLDGWAHEHQPSWPAWRACCSAPSRCRRGARPR